ncbi:MAG: ribonuclease III domain-containing protein [Eubacteriaceae bacterium]|nr:ribonuclease III domain-containing protein [Eubacteriaceae bacterium]
MNVKGINTTALAFMGDAVYEVYIRKFVLETGCSAADKLHKVTVQYVKADAQAKAIKGMFDELSEEEQTLVKRARNRKTATKAKNADPVTYKWSTAFEALVGYLYLNDDTERMEEVISRAMAIIQIKEA